MGSGPIRIVFTDEQNRRIQEVARLLYETKYRTQDKPQESFAADLGCTQPHISDLIRGETSLSVARAEKLAKLAGFPDLQAMVGPLLSGADGAAKPLPNTTKFPNLNTALLYHGNERWPMFVLAAAMNGLFGNVDVSPAEWARRLDDLTAHLETFDAK